MPVLIDGIIVYDLVHLVGALAMRDALRIHEADARAAAMQSTLDLSAAATNELAAACGPEGYCQGPLHAGIWQLLVSRSLVAAAATSRADAFWSVSLDLCRPMLNRWTWVHCLHAVGHGALKLLLYRTSERATGSVDIPVACQPAEHRELFLGAEDFAGALGLCKSAPSRGLAHACANGVWMDTIDMYISRRAAPFFAMGAPPRNRPAWLSMEGRGDGRRVPCDRDQFPAMCFARFYNYLMDLTAGHGAEQGRALAVAAAAVDGEEPAAAVLASLHANARPSVAPGLAHGPANGSANGLMDSGVDGHSGVTAASHEATSHEAGERSWEWLPAMEQAAGCLNERMASEVHVRGCIFGLSLNAFGRVLERWHGERDGALATWCGHFVDGPTAATPLPGRGGAVNASPSTAAASSRALYLGRLLACVAGSVTIGVSVGLTASDRMPSWAIDAYCARELAVSAMPWLRVDERTHAVTVCQQAGTLCSAPGSTCTDPTTSFIPAVARMLDHVHE